jgi:hypothetical protein
MDDQEVGERAPGVDADVHALPRGPLHAARPRRRVTSSVTTMVATIRRA